MSPDPHYADLSVVEAAIREWTWEQLACRTNNNHHWDDETVLHNTRDHFLQVTQVCTRCHNHRWREENENGYPLSKWQMEYQPGYLLPPKTGRIDDAGRALMRRTLRSIATVRRMPAKEAERGPRSGVTRRALGLVEDA